MKRIVSLLALALAVALASAAGKPRAAVLIILGQSNADGSAFADSALDDDMWNWYTSSPATSNLHIWYRSAVVHNDTDSLGRRSPHAYDGRYTDMPAGWMRLWYRNNNTGRQTSMNMIHGQGTYSVRSQQRRGIEGEFGRRWALKYPDTELYVIKLGVSGSRIDSWTASFDSHNWRYFIDNIYRPAMESLVNTGRQPYLAGVWWMQGEADQNLPAADYEKSLRLLEKRLSSLGFGAAPLYIGAIRSDSKGYGDGVRQAQQSVAAGLPEVTLVDTSDCPMQYEDAFKGCIHFSHAGVNCLADKLFDAIAARGVTAWKPLRFSGFCPEVEP